MKAGQRINDCRIFQWWRCLIYYYPQPMTRAHSQEYGVGYVMIAVWGMLGVTVSFTL